MSERQIVRIATPITEGNSTGYRLGYADEMRDGDELHETETATVALSVGISTAAMPMIEGESKVDFAERVTRVYAPLFASFSDEERKELAERLSDMTAEQEPPAAKETAAQKKARLAAEKLAATPPEPPVVEPVPPAPEPIAEPIAEAPAPAPEPVLPPPAAFAPTAAGWGTTPAV